MAQLFAKISGLFNSRPIGDAEATERYFELTKACMERVQKLILPSLPTSPKINFEQCNYLADKLNLAIESARLFLALLNNRYFWFPSPEDTASCLEIFKQLYAFAKEVENFIQSCCKDAWIQAALLLTNVSEHISLVGFNLELWTVVFSKIKQLEARRSLTLTQVDDIFKIEVESVKEKASLDRLSLLRNLNSEFQKRRNSPSAEHQLAVLLLERLGESRKVPLGESSLGSSQSRLSETISRSLEQMERLGKGSAGTVYRAKCLGVEVAKKTFYGPNFPDFEREVSSLQGLSHPNIASLLCYAKDKRECSIVMELMDEDLFSLIQRRLKSDKTREFPFGILEAIDIMLQVGEGMRYLHEIMRIVHRDLKSMNILVKCVRSSDSEIEYVSAKVADFGMSKTKEKSMTYSNQTLNIGTTRWMAPEVMKSCNAESAAEKSDGNAVVENYPFKSDIYSFGMVCYEILTGDTPFSSTVSVGDVKKMVLDGGRPPLPYECPSLLKDLIERCWSPDAKNRPGFGDICAKLRYLKCLFLSPSELRSISAAVNKSGSIPIGFKREAHGWFQWLVGLDIGTTHSGFAYAKVSDLDGMSVIYDYPYAEKPLYCKALTALYYNQATKLNCAAWGHLAEFNYLANVHSDRPGFYMPNFKLLLPTHLNNHPFTARKLPPPLTVNFILSDYLKHIGEHALTQIKNSCEHKESFRRDSVQWCVAVPPDWDDNAKQGMKECMVNAGLVSASEGGMVSVKFVLKSAAASFFCHSQLNHLSLHAKDKIMVVDIGGWTVDIVVQEVFIGSGNNFKVQELAKRRSSSLCGGTFVDDSFMSFLCKMIGCLDSFLRNDEPSYRLQLFNHWEDIKCVFAGHEVSSDSYAITLPEKLARKWEDHEREHGYPQRYSYAKIELSQKDLESIFDPVVDNILRLIAPQLLRVQDIKVMFVVGGFAGSPYVIQSIRGCFSSEVQHIFRPYDPGSAIMQGAIALALAP